MALSCSVTTALIVERIDLFRTRRGQRLPESRVTRTSNANPMAAMPLARIARLLAAQGNIRSSKSGMNLFGQSSAASPKARPSWTPAHSPKVFMASIPMREFYPLEREGGIDGQLRRLPRSANRASRRDRADRFSPAQRSCSSGWPSHRPLPLALAGSSHRVLIQCSNHLPAVFPFARRPRRYRRTPLWRLRCVGGWRHSHRSHGYATRRISPSLAGLQSGTRLPARIRRPTVPSPRIVARLRRTSHHHEESPWHQGVATVTTGVKPRGPLDQSLLRCLSHLGEPVHPRPRRRSPRAACPLANSAATLAVFDIPLSRLPISRGRRPTLDRPQEGPSSLLDASS
jgi:hypothetical protein